MGFAGKVKFQKVNARASNLLGFKIQEATLAMDLVPCPKTA